MTDAELRERSHALQGDRGWGNGCHDGSVPCGRTCIAILDALKRVRDEALGLVSGLEARIKDVERERDQLREDAHMLSGVAAQLREENQRALQRVADLERERDAARTLCPLDDYVVSRVPQGERGTP